MLGSFLKLPLLSKKTKNAKQTENKTKEAKLQILKSKQTLGKSKKSKTASIYGAVMAIAPVTRPHRCLALCFVAVSLGFVPFSIYPFVCFFVFCLGFWIV